MKKVICLLNELVLWGGKNIFKIYSCMLFQVLIDIDLRFCSQALALSFNEKRKSFNLIMFMLQFWSCMYHKLPQKNYVLQTSLKSLKSSMDSHILNDEMLVKVG